MSLTALKLAIAAIRNQQTLKPFLLTLRNQEQSMPLIAQGLNILMRSAIAMTNHFAQFPEYKQAVTEYDGLELEDCATQEARNLYVKSTTLEKQLYQWMVDAIAQGNAIKIVAGNGEEHIARTLGIIHSQSFLRYAENRNAEWCQLGVRLSIAQSVEVLEEGDRGEQ
jgi:hypothetical protein